MSETQTADWAAQRLERWRSARDGEALGELLKWQRVRAYATALRILRQDSDAEDAVQQAFLKLLTRTDGFESESAFKAAVYRAVVQCSLDLARARQARSGRESSMENVHAAATAMRSAEQEEALRLLHEELGGLSAEDRAVVTLCCQEGLNLTEAADVLGAPRETLRDRLARTLDGLRARLKKRGAPLSLLLLIGLLHQGQAHAAPAALASALDAALPGAGCAKIVAAGAVPVSATAVLAQAGLATGAVSALGIKLAGAAAAVAIALGGAAGWHAYSAQADAPGSAPTRKAESAPMIVGDAKPQASKSAAPAVAEGKTAVAPEKEPAAAPKPDAGVPIPDAVKAAAEAALKGFKITKVEKESKRGVTIYDLEGAADGKRYEMEISADGKVLELKEADDEDEKAEGAGDQKAKKPAPAPPDAF